MYKFSDIGWQNKGRLGVAPFNSITYRPQWHVEIFFYLFHVTKWKTWLMCREFNHLTDIQSDSQMTWAVKHECEIKWGLSELFVTSIWQCLERNTHIWELIFFFLIFFFITYSCSSLARKYMPHSCLVVQFIFIYLISLFLFYFLV